MKESKIDKKIAKARAKIAKASAKLDELIVKKAKAHAKKLAKDVEGTAPGVNNGEARVQVKSAGK